MSNENTLIIIPARKGSKGIPKKNMKIFNGKQRNSDDFCMDH